MRVAIDARGVQPKLHGVGRHVLNLLLGLSFRESELEFLVFYNSPLARKLVERSGGEFRNRFQWISAMSRPGGKLEAVELPWLLKINKADLFHDVGSTGIWTAGVQSVITVHELAALHFDDAKKKSKRQLKHALKNSRFIIAVSSSLADEIESELDISRPMIRVISNAIDPWYTERSGEKEVRAMRERFKLPGKYFLCVTADRAHKNAGLVVKMATEWNGSEQFVFTLAGQDRGQARFLDVVEDVWLRPLYAAATGVIVPSLYEGFSLPPIEALSTGALPVVSDIAPHREMLGGTLPDSLFFDPKSPESLQKAVQTAIDGESTRASVVEKFRALRDRYSFVETAQLVQAVYREALRG